MNLAPNLFDRRFSDLLEIGRARLPQLAPAWTDHNAHDPGITLIELLAWVAEAQLYSLSRLRKDERAAYAALLGLLPSGTAPATGVIWSDYRNPAAPVSTYGKSVVIGKESPVHVADAERPTFRPVDTLLWVPGRITSLTHRRRNGATVELMRANNRGVPFLPFGESADRRDVLSLGFECRDDAGIFGLRRVEMKGARWTIGVLTAPPASGAATAPQLSSATRRATSPLSATMVTSDARVPLRIVSDTTDGFLRSGALLLDLDAVEDSPQTFAIELRGASGLARPPRILRIEPNVVPVRQGEAITREPHESKGEQDWRFALEQSGLSFEAGKQPVTIEVSELAGVATWQRIDNVAAAGPDDNVYEFDRRTNTVMFGNGINGRIPPAGSAALASYSISDGAMGRVPRNRSWQVTGISGVFGVNVDPILDGVPASGFDDQRRLARRLVRDEHALVSSSDIANAAIALPLLEVVRAWVVEPGSLTPRSGAIRLIVMRSRPGGVEPEGTPETPRWLDAIRGRLVPRLPLGLRLSVTAPRYVEFSIRMRVESEQGHDSTMVEKAIGEELRKRLALVPTGKGVVPRSPGLGVTTRDVAAWVLGVAGVKRIDAVALVDVKGNAKDAIDVPPTGLPKWQGAASAIAVRREGQAA